MKKTMRFYHTWATVEHEGHYATSWNVIGSILDEVIEYF
jgi:hypothetical protein